MSSGPIKKTNNKILYIGGFELPDKNAAAQRVVGIAKALRELGYNVVFLNALKVNGSKTEIKKQYFGFECLEYQREKEYDYLFTAKTVLTKIAKVNPDIVIAYNYPAYALDRVRKYCNSKGIMCYADVTEWYQAFGTNPLYRLIKNIDTKYRMEVVHKKMDGVIAISRFLYDYYRDYVKTIIIPPTVDLNEDKWNVPVEKENDVVSFVYAGSPSAQKEKLDLIVRAIEDVPHEYGVRLNVVGITMNQYKQIYNAQSVPFERIKFWGRVEHREAIKMIKESDWSIIIRENNRVVKAGFPTKVVESISCGTPVIVNEFSNIADYLDASNSIMVSDINNIDHVIIEAIKKKLVIKNVIFDYHKYMEELKCFL